MQLVRRLWTEENVTYDGEHFQVTDSTVAARASSVAATGAHPEALLRRRLRGRRAGRRRPRPTSSCSGASRWTASRERIERLQRR